MGAVREGTVAQAVTRPDGSIDLNATAHEPPEQMGFLCGWHTASR